MVKTVDIFCSILTTYRNRTDAEGNIRRCPSRNTSGIHNKIVHKVCKTVLSGITKIRDAAQSGLFCFRTLVKGTEKTAKKYLEEEHEETAFKQYTESQGIRLQAV